MLMTYSRRDRTRSQEPAPGYRAPTNVKEIWLKDALHRAGRGALSPRQLEFFRSGNEGQAEDVELFYAGDVRLLERRCVSIVGTREATFEGLSRAARLGKELASAGVAVVSGLARGIDGAAHRSTIDNGGRAIAVIGTPLSKASPSENASLQEEIWRRHLLISPFKEGTRVFRANFPRRNRVMAAISDATVIIEASDTSGTLHQAAECQRLGRWLFIARAVLEDDKLKWPGKFLGQPKTKIMASTADVLDCLGI